MVDLMREEKLFSWQGGPIIMLQVVRQFWSSIGTLHRLAVWAYLSTWDLRALFGLWDLQVESRIIEGMGLL